MVIRQQITSILVSFWHFTLFFLCFLFFILSLYIYTVFDVDFFQRWNENVAFNLEFKISKNIVRANVVCINKLWPKVTFFQKMLGTILLLLATNWYSFNSFCSIVCICCVLEENNSRALFSKSLNLLKFICSHRVSPCSSSESTDGPLSPSDVYFRIHSDNLCSAKLPWRSWNFFLTYIGLLNTESNW